MKEIAEELSDIMLLWEPIITARGKPVETVLDFGRFLPKLSAVSTDKLHVVVIEIL